VTAEADAVHSIKEPFRIAGMLMLAALVAGAGLGLADPVSAAERPDTSEWKCEKCPFARGYQANYSIGASYVTDDAARFGDETGYDHKGGYVEAGGEGRFTSDDYRMQWTLEDLGLDSRFVAIEGGKPGTYDYRLAYRQLPHRVFDTTETVYRASSDDTLVLPDAWIRAPQTSGFAALDSSLFSRDVESDRKRIEAGGRYRTARSLEFFVDARTEQRDGTDIIAGSFFTQGNLLPRPFDYRTDSVNLGVRWRGQRGFASLSYSGSFFSDETTALIWDNAFTGPEQGALAQPPDNEFQQVALTASYRFPFDTVLSASAALGRLEQDDDLLAYSTNAAIAPTLPRATLDGKVDTTHLALSATSRPFSFARLSAAIRYDERDDRTPVASWDRILVDAFPSTDQELNTPYGFERTRLDLAADVDLLRTLRASAGYTRNEFDRDLQSVAEQTENSGWGRLRWRPNAYLDLNARLGAAKREIDRLDESVLIAAGENPLMRKYNLAHRYREFADVMLSGSVPGWPISGSASYLHARDDYSQSVIGLTESEEQSFAADFSWTLSDNTVAYLNGSYEEIDAHQASSQSFGTPDWTAVNNDRFYTVGGGLRARLLADRVELRLDYTHGEGTGRIVVDGAAASGDGRFPDLDTTLDSLRASASYRWSDRAEATFQLRYERFEAEDWALEGVAPDTIPAVLTLGADPYDYDVVVIGIGVRYRFGAGTASSTTTGEAAQ
jgi:MtrB/PioB family decaheme-associated outer membrane protein